MWVCLLAKTWHSSGRNVVRGKWGGGALLFVSIAREELLSFHLLISNPTLVHVNGNIF